MQRSGKLAVVCVVLCVVCVLLLQGGAYLYQNVIMEQFEPGSYELDYDDTAEMKEALAACGVDVQLPCVPEDGATFVISEDLEYRYMISLQEVAAGTEIWTDFFSYGCSYNSAQRAIMLREGKYTRDVQMEFDDLIALYMDYIEQSGLEAQFEAETGMTYTRRHVREALLQIDRQCYQMGIADFGTWPINRYVTQERVNTATVAGVVILIVLCVVIGLLVNRKQQDRYWAIWLRGNQRRYDNAELPQFHSLRATGEDQLPKRSGKVTFGEKLRRTFRSGAEAQDHQKNQKD